MKSHTKYTRIATLSVAALLMAMPALAQQTLEERSDSIMNMEQPQSGSDDQSNATEKSIAGDYSDDMSALGQAVRSSDGEDSVKSPRSTST